MENKITIQDKEITVLRVRVKNAPAVMQASLPFLDAFDELGKQTERDKEFKRSNLLKIIAKHMPDFTTLVLQLTDLDDRAWIENLYPQPFYELVEFVISHSADFFLTQIVEPLEKLTTTILKVGTQQNSV